MPRITETRQPAAPSSAEQKERYRRILRAAGRLGAEHGLERMQMHDVAKEAGVAIATLYRYFPSKTELFVGVLQQQVERLSREDLSPATTATRADAVADILIAASQRMLERPQLAIAMMQSNNAAQLQGARTYNDTSLTFHRVLLDALGVGDDPGEEDQRMVRITEQTWYGILISALNGVIDLTQGERDIRLAVNLILGPRYDGVGTTEAGPPA